jgi:hypothetical protein
MDKSLRIYKVTYNQEDNQILETELDYSLTSYRLSATRMGAAPIIMRHYKVCSSYRNPLIIGHLSFNVIWDYE